MLVFEFILLLMEQFQPEWMVVRGFPQSTVGILNMRGYFHICLYADLPALQPSPPKNTVNNWCVLDFFGTMAASMACIAIGPIPYIVRNPFCSCWAIIHYMFSRESLVTVAGWGVDRTYSDGLKFCSKANLKVMTAFCRCEGTRVQMQ